MTQTSASPRPPQPMAPANEGGGGRADWSFARRPFWLFSHLFALSVVVLFVNLGLWQLGRHDARQEFNTFIEARTTAQPITVGGADAVAGDGADLDYRAAVVSGVFVDDDFARVVNRSQGGVAGQYVVGLVELADGSTIAVNRGFAPSNIEPVIRPTPTGPTVVTGWLRDSVEKGRFGADDSGTGALVPRMNTDDLAVRLGSDLPEVWLQVADEGRPLDGDSPFPDPVPLPDLDDGPHLGYAAQWFIFAFLGVLFYGAMLRRQSRVQ